MTSRALTVIVQLALWAMICGIVYLIARARRQAPPAPLDDMPIARGGWWTVTTPSGVTIEAESVDEIRDLLEVLEGVDIL